MILKVNKDSCEIKENEIWNVGDYNVHTVQVELSEEFNGLVNKVRYFVEDNSYDMLITDNVAQVPYEATLTEGTIKIGVYGYDADTDILVQSTSPVNKFITSGTYTGEADNTEPLTPTDKQQMESAIQKNADDIINLQNNKQDVLISGENIKTINNESILGSGNIEIDVGSINYNDLENKPKINNVELNENKSLSDLGIQPAGNYALESEIPTKTSDLTNDSGFISNTTNNLVNYTLKTNTGSLIDLEINQTTYVVTLSLKDVDGNIISTDTIDLPLENVVVSGAYDSTNQKIVLTLQSGDTVDIPVGALVSGLQSEITSQNKLASDLVDDTNSGNKFVTTSEKQTWNNKLDQSDLTDYVKNTDYASSSKGGVIKTGSGTNVDNNGIIYADNQTYPDYSSSSNNNFISKGTLENVITGKNLETANNKVTSISSESTDTQYPSAKCVHDSQATQDDEIETLQTENERLKATLPTTTGEGQDITLDKTAEMEFVKPPLPMGNSEQEGEPRPDNAVPITNVTGNVEVTISNENNTESKTLPVSLGNIELCKIGDYQDYLYKNNGKWYVHKNTIKIDLSTITSYTHTSGWRNPTAFVADGVFNHGYSGYTTVASLFCNRLIADTPARVTGSVINAIGLGRNSSIYISVEGITTSNALITYFSQNPTYLYAPLATPTDTEITDTTLISQLEEISKTLSYQGQTNITSNTIALFDVEAYQDLKIILTKYVTFDDIQSLNGDEVNY